MLFRYSAFMNTSTIDPFDCYSDSCHLAWLLRDNRQLLPGFRYGMPTCDDGAYFDQLSPSLFADCPWITIYPIRKRYWVALKALTHISSNYNLDISKKSAKYLLCIWKSISLLTNFICYLRWLRPGIFLSDY